jgi:hypothetical protein
MEKPEIDIYVQRSKYDSVCKSRGCLVGKKYPNVLTTLWIAILDFI